MLEFLILRKRLSCPSPYINILHEVHNLTDQRTHSSQRFPLSSVISSDKSLPAETNTFSNEDASFPLGFANESASGGELRSISLQSSSPKCKAWCSLIKELGLARVAKLTTQKEIVGQNSDQESTLSKL
jgi:hypothetical protein